MSILVLNDEEKYEQFVEVLRNCHNKTLTNEQAVDSIAKSTKNFNYSFVKQLDGNNLRQAKTHTT